MTYNINNTIGTQLFQVADGTINSDLSLTLVGRNYSGWGETVNENFVKLLENSASSNEPAPAKLLTGQLWYDTGDSVAGRLPQLKIYNGTRFKPLPVAISGSAPTGAAMGDMWWDSVNKQLKVYDGAAWLTIGPLATNSGASKTGLFTETILDNSGTSHTVSILYVAGVRVSIASTDTVFTPAAALAADLVGFSTIGPGVNINTNMAGGTARFVGTAANSDKIAGYTWPSLAGNSTKYLTTTDGLTLSWGTVSAGGATTLRGLTDVGLSATVATGEVLKYDSGTSQWVNSPNTITLGVLGAGSAGGAAVSLTTSPVSITFSGNGVTTTASSGAVTVNIPGASSGTTLPATATGYLFNNGSGTLSWGTPTASSSSTGISSFQVQYFIVAGSSTWTVPAGVTKLRVQIQSGIYNNGTNLVFSSAAGFVTVTPGASINVTVGAPGATTSFGTYLSAAGSGTSSISGAATGSALITTYAIGMVNGISKSYDGTLANQTAGVSSIPAVTAAFNSGTPSTLNGYVIIEY
jgi:hypothetical protein